MSLNLHRLQALADDTKSSPPWTAPNFSKSHLPVPSSTHFCFRSPGLRLQATRRPPSYPQEGENSAADPRIWNRNRNDMTFFGDYDEDDDEDDEEEEEDDRSMDLLIRFVENVFKKISKRARKAVRSVLPINIPTKLVLICISQVINLIQFVDNQLPKANPSLYRNLHLRMEHGRMLRRLCQHLILNFKSLTKIVGLIKEVHSLVKLVQRHL
ncbi:unnamed protein product [Lactuca virosa]|uniref:Uncharacterized protein n=1 Tax=Lactuca virosa TaxID=75947 RepID=A0AAU9NGZ1_9ASTR|nr:unnamed protein product [Lactuca virosa]